LQHIYFKFGTVQVRQTGLTEKQAKLSNTSLFCKKILLDIIWQKRDTCKLL